MLPPKSICLKVTKFVVPSGSKIFPDLGNII